MSAADGPSAGAIARVARRLREARAQQVFRDTAGSLATAMLSQVVLVASGILVARALGPTDRGYLALLVLVPVVIIVLGSLGVPTALTYELARDPRATRILMRRLVSTYAAQNVALVLVHAVVLWRLLQGKPDDVVVPALVTLALVPTVLAHDYGLAILQGHQRFGAFNALRVLPATIYGIGVVVVFAWGAADLLNVALVWVCANATVAVGTVAIAARTVAATQAAQVDAAGVGDMVRFGLRGLLGSASPIETFRLDQTVIGLFLAPAALGYYVAGLAFTNLPRFLASSVGMVAYPHVARQPTREQAWRTTWRFFSLAAALTLPVVLALEATVGWLLPFLFGDDFNSAVPMARILLVAAFCSAVRRTLTDGARGLGHPGLGTLAEVSSWIVLIPAIAVAASSSDPTVVAVAVALTSFSSLAVLIVSLLWVERRRRTDGLTAPTPAGRPRAAGSGR